MMRLQLEVFETPENPRETPTLVLDAIAYEDAKLTAYDKGYKAGWDDAVQARSDEQTGLSAELAQHLKSLGFTHAAARDHVLQSIHPLLEQLVGQLLPEIARDTLAPFAVQVLMPLAESAADQPMDLVIHPASTDAVRHLLDMTGNLNVTLIQEPTLGEGQAYLRHGSAETQIDLTAAIAQITAAIRNFYDLPERTADHG